MWQKIPLNCSQDDSGRKEMSSKTLPWGSSRPLSEFPPRQEHCLSIGAITDVVLTELSACSARFRLWVLYAAV
jgi:hypothetical protein